ncbi:MAG: DMT family transporter [Rhodospirillales bacterium]|nr:DMT family transporter [Rhodospirillales bacterium]MDP6644111.1 DMT family transporter [Rhodospirillales bacterium]MDP6843398.1 DMT family transporter [Rhodospirillales bacterium]
MKIPAEFKPTPAVAYGLVTAAAFLWAASTVIGRGVHQELPPLGMTFWRWFLAALVLLLFVWRELPRKRALIAEHWRLILLLGFFQVGSSALLFLGVNFTTAINATLLNAAQPALTVVPAWLLTRDRVTPGQGLGIFAALAGIIVMVSQGKLGVLVALQLNVGDILALLAILGWTIYATILHRLPAELGFATTMFVIFLSGSLIVLPFYIIESAAFRVMPFTGSAVGIVAMLGIVVSLGSIAMWNTSLRVVGPNRATIFLNLVPIFGVSLAIIFLGERLFAHHLAGAGLVALGIVLVVLRARRRSESG